MGGSPTSTTTSCRPRLYASAFARVARVAGILSPARMKRISQNLVAASCAAIFPNVKTLKRLRSFGLLGKSLKEPVRDFRRAAFIHNFRQPECAKAAAALSRAQELGGAADLVTSTFSEVKHEALCAALPPAVEAARAACTAFAAAPKSPSVKIQSDEQALADDLKSAADLLDVAHQRARHFHLSAGVDINKKLVEKIFDANTR